MEFEDVPPIEIPGEEEIPRYEDSEYVVAIPGMEGIFRIPFVTKTNQELAIGRVQQCKNSESPVPEMLQWIPGVINMIDDNQDMLYTGLILAKKLLIKLPFRFIPVLGWVLLANDLMNLSTIILGAVTGGPTQKRLAKNLFQFFGNARKGPRGRVTMFFGKTAWLAFSLQAAQVTENLFGFGLRLGGIMGALSDSFWGAIRVLAGKSVRIAGPPPDDIVHKAVRVLCQNSMMSGMNIPLSKEDIQLMMAGSKMAVNIINEYADPAKFEGSMDIMGETEQPTFIPWQEGSREALRLEGIDPDGEGRPYSMIEGNKIKIKDLFPERVKESYSFQQHMREIYTGESWGTVLQLLHQESAIDLLEFSVGNKPAIYEDISTLQLLCYKSPEFDVFGNNDLTIERLSSNIGLLDIIMEKEMRRVPTYNNLKQMHAYTSDGWHKRGIGTETEPAEEYRPWQVEV